MIGRGLAISGAIIGIVSLTGCSGSGSLSIGSLNPFSRSTAEPATIEPVKEFDDTPSFVAAPLPPEYQRIADIERLWLDYSPRGIIVRADVVTDGLGYYAPVLFAPQKGRADANGNVRFEFFAIPPETLVPNPSARARTLSAAAFLPNARLGAVKSVTVAGAGNERVVRLR